MTNRKYITSFYNTQVTWAGAVGQGVERLPSKLKALSSIPRITKEKGRKEGKKERKEEERKKPMV
jgi:hypothetical protein